MSRALSVACPAATVVDAPPVDPDGLGATVVCGILENANVAVAGRGPGKNRGEGDPTFRAGEPPAVDGGLNQVQALCGGPSIPGGPLCYTACGTWRRAKDAERERMRLKAGELNVGDAQVRRPLPSPFEDQAA